jgi:hypothetical protein
MISHFDYFITFLNLIWRTGNYLYRFINIKQDISHSLLGSKKNARFRKLHLKNVICNEAAVYFLGAKNMLLIWVEGFVVLYRYKRFRWTCLQEYSASHPKDTSLHKPCCHDITLLQHVTSKAIDITTHKLPYAPPALSRKKLCILSTELIFVHLMKLSFQARSETCEKRLLALSCLYKRSVCV